VIKPEELEPVSDDDILLAFRKGTAPEKAFLMLVNKYQHSLYRQIRRMVPTHEDADDVLQEVFLKVWRHIQGFERRSALSTWLYRIAANEALNFLDRQTRQPLAMVVNVAEDNGKEPVASLPTTGEQIEKLLAEAYRTLPDKQRQVFELRYFEALSYRKMADLLQTSEGSLKASYHHAVKKIEAYIRSHSEF